MEAEPMIQGSQEWIDARLGHVTASRFSDVLTQPRSKADKEAGNLSLTAERYMIDLIGEHLTQEPAEELKTYAMDWGNTWEPVARETYRQRTNFFGTTAPQFGHSCDVP